MEVVTTRALLDKAEQGKYLGFRLYGAGMDVRVMPGSYNGNRMVGTVRHALRKGKDGVNYYFNNGKHDVFSFNVCQGFDYEMNRYGDFTVSRAGVSCTMYTHIN
jgi:hypothetical protein